MNQHVVCGSHRSYLILAAAVFLFSIASSRTAFSQDAQEALRKSDTLISQGKLAEARDVLLPALDALPKDDADRRFDILFKLGYLLDKIDPKRGIAYLEEALKLRPKYATAWGNMGWNAYLAGDLEKAVSSTLRCLELDKTLAYAWANLGLYHFAQGETKKMDDAYNNAFHWADSPDDLEGAVTDAEELCQKKPGDECTKLLNRLNTDRKSLEKRPAHLKAWSVKNQEIRALLRKGSHGAALAMADSLLKAVEKELGKDHFTYVVTMSTLGVAQMELGKTADAEETLLSEHDALPRHTRQSRGALRGHGKLAKGRGDSSPNTEGTGGNAGSESPVAGQYSQPAGRNVQEAGQGPGWRRLQEARPVDSGLSVRNAGLSLALWRG